LNKIIDSKKINSYEIKLEDEFHICNCHWFPKKCENDNLQAGMSNDKNIKFYHGWFESYTNKWIPLSIKCEPLIFSDKHCRKPIMLCYYKYKIKNKKPIGAYILTTMYLGSSGHEQLIKNLFELPTTIASYYKDLTKDFMKRVYLSVLLLIVFIFLIYAIIVYLIPFLGLGIVYLDNMKVILIPVAALIIGNLLLEPIKRIVFKGKGKNND
jgi:hypothetical protein